MTHLPQNGNPDGTVVVVPTMYSTQSYPVNPQLALMFRLDVRRFFARLFSR